MMNYEEKDLKRGRLMYIFEAALEHLIALLVAGSFLATLTKSLGMSDSLTGVLSSVISLGCLFQLMSLSVKKTRVKKLVVCLSALNQILFMLLYVIPLSGAGKQVKIAAFVVMIFSAYFIYNFVHPKKINWLMSLVEDGHRGTFTANKEIVSLVIGIVFSFVMGAVSDHFAEKGQIHTAFAICAAVMFVLMVLHTLTMVLTVEKEIPCKKAAKGFSVIDSLKNKNILGVTVVFVLYNISNYASVPFYGTYKINELGFDLKLVSAIVICGSGVRVLVSKFWGRYADRESFAAMLEKCLIFLALGQVCAAMAVPSNGLVMFILYYAFHGVAMGGINSALVNLIFDYVEPEKRSNSLAITQAASGLVGFLTTLCMSPLVAAIQANGNKILGIPLYAQQVVTVISLVFTIFAIIYTRAVLIKKKKATQ